MGPRFENIDLTVPAPLNELVAQAALADAGGGNDADGAANSLLGVEQGLFENPKFLLPPAQWQKALIAEPIAGYRRFQPKQAKHLDRPRNALERARARKASVAIGTD